MLFISLPYWHFLPRLKTITWFQRRIARGAAWTAGASLMATSLTAAPNTNGFGFAGRESFPIDSQISHLHVADLDGDGLNDIIVVNNARSKINLLYNQTGKTNLTQKPKPTVKPELNEIGRAHV